MAKSALGAALPVGASKLLSALVAGKAPVLRPAQPPPELEKFPTLELPPAVDADELPQRCAIEAVGSSWEAGATCAFEPGPCLSTLMQGLLLSTAASKEVGRRPSAELKRKLLAEDLASYARTPPKVARPRPVPEPPELLATLAALELPEACEPEEEEMFELVSGEGTTSGMPVPQALALSDSDEECFSPAISAWLAAKAATATVEAAGEFEVTWSVSDEGPFKLGEDHIFEVPSRRKTRVGKPGKGSPRMSLCSTAVGSPRASVFSVSSERLSISEWPGLSF